MSHARLLVVLVTLMGLFFACGAFTQSPDEPRAFIVAGILCSLIPLVLVGFGYYAWRTGFLLGIDPPER